MEIKEILKYFLPEEITEHFDLVSIEESKEGKLIFNIYEKNIKPSEHKDKELESRGFLDFVMIQDFPIRDKQVFLAVRRRKWKDKKTGKNYTRDWELVAQGTRFTKEFAAFLKELVR